MQSFLEETIEKIMSSTADISQLKIILPSKRAGGFFKQYLNRKLVQTSFAPQILSIEEFIQQISGLSLINPTELLFKSYTVYLETDTFKEKDNFQNYNNWATTLLNDFNEIDRYLIEPKRFFGYLNSIKVLERWNIDETGKTEIINNYLNFWDSLLPFYKNLTSVLEKENLGYQGAIYKKAADRIEEYISGNEQEHIFIGFNALNSAEQKIITTLQNEGLAKVYWDVDKHFYEDIKHSASLFIRRYASQWGYYERNPLETISSNFEKQKSFTSIEVQKNIGQVKYIGELLTSYSNKQLDNTAVVLADESLLVPLLHSLPNNVQQVNVTMGVPLSNFPIASFFEILLSLHEKEGNSYYYKDVFKLLQHPISQKILSNATKIVDAIQKENRTQISLKYLLEKASQIDADMLNRLFRTWDDNTTTAIQNCLEIIGLLKTKPSDTVMDRVVLFELYKVLKEIEALNTSFEMLSKIKTVQDLYTQAIASSTVDFQGDAYNGLQIMGVLESRVLDFENIIIASVNEGIFPSGKSNASFITYDIKKEFELPLYTEKDAIYTYHFYKMLHRARNITLLYNNHSEGINTGEKSRFLLQLEIDKHPNHSFEKKVISPKISVPKKQLKLIVKTSEINERLKAIAASKFSPSALTSYIRNPIDFYYDKILNIKESEAVEETIAANTLGTVVHNALEELYTPFLNTLLTSDLLREKKKEISAEVQKQFTLNFSDATNAKGKNLLILEVAKRFISNFMDYEISEIENGSQIELISLEKKMVVELDIPSLKFPVKIGGTVDRVDRYNGTLRIIDYKTGAVQQNEVAIKEWEQLNQDYKFSKAFQVLAYALMMKESIVDDNAMAGIISFKNMGGGFLPFRNKNKDKNTMHLLDTETLENFRNQLTILIEEICNPEIPFTEKEID